MKKARTNLKNNTIRVGVVVPHIFMQRDILPHVIFSPGQLALDLSQGLNKNGADVTIFTPGRVNTAVKNISADLSYFENELSLRGDSYIDLLKKHPFTFITLARQVQSELIAKAFEMANNDELDIVHIYTNEEDIALPFAKFCKKTVVFTHHDPFNFLVKYKNLFPKYKDLNWISMSFAQRKGMPPDTNWVANIYHGLEPNLYKTANNPSSDYFAYLGRIIQPKGLHLAIDAMKEFNKNAAKPVKLKIAGKHYSGHKDKYWQEQIVPRLEDSAIEYAGYLSEDEKRHLLANARALIEPALFDEPFGMVAIEALASGTPVVALDSGALPELVSDGKTGYIVAKVFRPDGRLDEQGTVKNLVSALRKTDEADRKLCRYEFEQHFTLNRMCNEHLELYEKLTRLPDQF